MYAENRNEKTIQIEKKVTAIGVPGVEIVFARVPFIQYSQVLLTKNFRKIF